MTSIESQPTLFQVPKAHLGNALLQHPGTLILQGLFEGGYTIYMNKHVWSKWLTTPKNNIYTSHHYFTYFTNLL